MILSPHNLCIAAPYTPLASPDVLFPGTWYLESIDKMHRRTYKRVPQKPVEAEPIFMWHSLYSCFCVLKNLNIIEAHFKYYNAQHL